MIWYFMKRRKDRFRLAVPLAICFTLCWLTGGLGESAVKKPSQWLKEVRDGLVKDHYSLVFIFGKSFSFTPPVVKENEALIKFGDTKTALPPSRELRSFNSLLRLEKKGADLEALIAIPKGFSRITYVRAKGPERLIVRFSRDEGPVVSAAAAIPPPQVNHEELTAGEIIPDTRNLKASRGPDRAVVKPLSPLEPQMLRSYNFQDIDIRQALSALAQDQEINMIMSPEVAGKISIHLNQVTLEEAVRSITLAGGFTFRKQDDGYYIYKSKLVLDPQSEKLQIRIFRLNFAAIDKVQEILSAIPGMRTIRLHEPTKTIIVEDTPENIAKIETVLRSWDMAPRQVLIEAQIMQVKLTDDMSLGVDWQKVFGDLTIGTAGFTAGLGAAVMPALGFGANIVTAAGSRHQFMAAINALQEKTKVNFLSTPKILALHGKTARVQIGGKFGYKTNTFTPTGTTEDVKFLDTGTILDITPYIDDNGNVLLEVNPQINSAALAGGVPIQQTTTVKTSMLAKNGQTMFIGGLIEDSKTGTKNAIPCLGSIPGLGLLFGSMSDKISKDELIILITPQIIDQDKPSAEGLEKVRQIEDKLKKEPLPLKQRLLKDLP